MKYSLWIFWILLSIRFVLSQIYTIDLQNEIWNPLPFQKIDLSKNWIITGTSSEYNLTWANSLRVYYTGDMNSLDDLTIIYTWLYVIAPVSIYKNRLWKEIEVILLVDKNDVKQNAQWLSEIKISKDMIFHEQSLCNKYIPYWDQKYCFLLWKKVGLYMQFTSNTQTWFVISIQ
jgi:hypothetical protein